MVLEEVKDAEEAFWWELGGSHDLLRVECEWRRGDRAGRGFGLRSEAIAEIEAGFTPVRSEVRQSTLVRPSRQERKSRVTPPQVHSPSLACTATYPARSAATETRPTSS